jgi:calcineurin-like phosphoesterase family protein
MSTFFTSDHHFGHANILRYQAETRPYKNLHDMHVAYTEQWNRQVGPDDTVYHLGDLCMGGYHDCVKYISRLNGKIMLVPGNHDKWFRDNMHRPPESASGYKIQVLPLIHIAHHEGQMLVMCHYPMRSWPHSFYDAWQLYGHVHKALTPWGLSMDVGVDSRVGRLCAWDDITQHMAKQKQWLQEHKDQFARIPKVEDRDDEEEGTNVG